MRLNGLVTFCAPQSLTSFLSSKDELLSLGVKIELKQFLEIRRFSWPRAFILDLILLWRMAIGSWDFIILNSGASLLIRPRLLRSFLAITQYRGIPCFVLWRNADEKFRSIEGDIGQKKLKVLLSRLSDQNITHLAISDRTAKEVGHRLGIDHITNIRNCRRMPPKYLDPRPPKWPPTILNVASIRMRKGPDMFISIANKVCSKNPDVIFRWVGGKPDNKLQELINRSAYSNRIEFIEHVADPYQYMIDAYCLLLTSREEAFGLVLAEAMACSRTVLCFAGTGAAEVAGDSGRIFDRTDEDGLVEFLIDYVNLPPEQAINRAAAQRYLELYSPSGYAKCLTKVILDKLDNSSNPE